MWSQINYLNTIIHQILLQKPHNCNQKFFRNARSHLKAHLWSTVRIKRSGNMYTIRLPGKMENNPMWIPNTNLQSQIKKFIFTQLMRNTASKILKSETKLIMIPERWNQTPMLQNYWHHQSCTWGQESKPHLQFHGQNPNMHLQIYPLNFFLRYTREIVYCATHWNCKKKIE